MPPKEPEFRVHLFPFGRGHLRNRLAFPPRFGGGGGGAGCHPQQGAGQEQKHEAFNRGYFHEPAVSGLSLKFSTSQIILKAGDRYDWQRSQPLTFLVISATRL